MLDGLDGERMRLFGQRLRERRQEAGLSQGEVADRAGVDRSFLSNVERGGRNIGLVKVFALADALGVDVGDLFIDLRD